MSILIIAGTEDPQGKRVAAEAEGLGAQVSWFDAPAFPEQTKLTFQGGAIFLNGKPFSLPSAAYLRSLGSHLLAPGFQENLDRRPRGLIAQKRVLLESFLLSLQGRGVRLINDLATNAHHSQRPYQLELLRTRGMSVPRSLATNDPAAVRRFARQVKNVVYRPLAGGDAMRLLQKEDLNDDHVAALAYAPVFFQELIEGPRIRAFVVGKRVVAAAEVEVSDLDYVAEDVVASATRLTAEERRAAVVASRACGMLFAGVELIRTAKGFSLLECNPSPTFAKFEEKTGLDVAGPLAALLHQPETAN
jgi:glutathione synthase/RimK-type ligase-like ATP-grasp enzyme